MKPLWRAIEALAWIAFFVFATLVLALRFWLLPDIERYRGDIVAAIERSVGLPIKIGGIEAGWLGLHPRVSLSDVRLYDHQGREVLALPSIRNVVSWRSLLYGQIRLHSLAVDGPRLDVRRGADGALYVAGMKLAADGERHFADWLLGQEEIVISNAEIEWRDEKRAAPPLALSALNLRLRNSGDQHSIGLTARPPEELGSSVELRAQLEGRSATDPAAWNGRLYAQLGYTDLAAWRAWIDYPLDVRAGQGAIRFSTALEPLAQLAATLPLPADVRRLLADLAPRGRLLDTKLEWSGDLAAPKRIAVRGRFADLGMHARGEVPGFSGLSGSIEASEAKGSVSLASRKAELDFPRIFPEPRIPLETLNGRIDWERQGERQVAVRFSSLNFSNAQLSGNASGAYTYTGSGRGTIDLSAQLNRADGAQVARYLPLPEIMGKATRDWLAAGIVSGQASDVRLRLRGELRDFPFADPAQGQFLVSARVEKGVLNYANGWPLVYDIDGELLFERDRMEIVGRRGTLLGAQLANVRVGIPSLVARERLVVISGQADGNTGDFLKFIDATPVKRMTGGFTEQMSALGKGRLHLKLELPIGNLAATKLAGEDQFANNSLTLHPQLPPVEHATGKVGFTESTLAVNDVRGRLFGGPLAVSGGSRPGGGGRRGVGEGGGAPARGRAGFGAPRRRQPSGAGG